MDMSGLRHFGSELGKFSGRFLVNKYLVSWILRWGSIGNNLLDG
jgi:hypothetical protein